MSKNIFQVYTTNPITTNQSTDLMYFGRSPYGIGDDAGMTFANFAAQFGTPYTASALTKTDDTNVTLTLGGTPATALLQSVALTLGWTGQLSVPRGGTGAASFTAYSVICGGITSTGALQSVVGVGTSGQQLTSNGPGALPTWQAGTVISAAALTKTDDTNVTLTLGGSPTTALLAATSLTLGWTGLLSPARGGTGVNNGTSTLTLGGSLTTVGAFTASFTFTGNTSVTFPTSGTLATTATASGIVNSGTINQLAWYSASGTTISGLTIVNSAGLLTNGSGVPAWVAYTGTGSPVLATSPTITTPRIAQINDTNGNAMLTMNLNASAVNNWAMNNSATGNAVQFAPIGTDTNISTQFLTKGTGTHSFYSANATTPILWVTGTGYQHQTVWNISNTSATRNVTLQDADGTLAYLADRGWVQISSANGAGTAAVIFTGLTGYSHYCLVYQNFSPVTNGVNMALQASINNGSTYLNGASDYIYQAALFNNTTSSMSASTTTYFPLNALITNIAGGGGFGMIYVTNVTSTSAKKGLLNSCAYYQAASPVNSYQTFGEVNTTSAVNALQVLFTSGNISTGTVTLYGIK